jgi:hypothetical protein
MFLYKRCKLNRCLLNGEIIPATKPICDNSLLARVAPIYWLKNEKKMKVKKESIILLRVASKLFIKVGKEQGYRKLL